MIRKSFFILLFVGIWSCSQTKSTESYNSTSAEEMHNAETALNFDGVYAGRIPCADCQGIKQNITILPNGNYKKISVYIDTARPEPIIKEGRWKIDKNTLTLLGEEAPNMYLVGENYVRQLDKKGEIIPGEGYQLKKLPEIEGQWRILILNGEELTKDASITFETAENRISANGGCNKMAGKLIQSGNRLEVSEIASTKMACKNDLMKLDVTLGKALQSVNSYSMDQGRLMLNNKEDKTVVVLTK